MPEIFEIAFIEPTPRSECLNEFTFRLRILDPIADKSEDCQQTNEPEEVRIFLCEELHSAEIRIDGKNSWELVMEKGGKSLIKALWTNGVDLTTLDEDGKTMLHVAVEHRNEPVVVLLHTLGINMKSKDTNGMTALDYANEGSMTSMQNLLQEHGAYKC
ncbi:hypothetical protein V496_00059 [Pseudogymnoascus sp. VKM F-4515 (FW-2607)]|nr:hypothetical protein V496_00059 [Pseudogymnoascus sp. VKM F-4515 (FW-2607)]